MENKTGEIISEKLLAQSPIFTVYDRQVKSSFDGVVVHRQVVDHGNSIAVLPFERINGDYKLYLSEEFRAGMNTTTKGIVAGMINGDEAPDHAAKRELREEMGLLLNSSSDLVLVDRINTSEGFTNEQTYIYLVELTTNNHNFTDKRDFDKDEDVGKWEYIASTSELNKLPSVLDIHSAQGVVALQGLFIYLNS